MEKEVFERLISEYGELNVKTTKLREFLMDPEKSKNVDNLNKDLLIIQLKSMEAYLSTLSVRIGLNSPRDPEVEDAVEIVSE